MPRNALHLKELPSGKVVAIPTKSLLDEAIEKHKIPRWPYEAVYDRIIVFSVPEDAASRETYSAGGIVIKLDTVKKREEDATPRGVLVSAGMGAQDVLRSHGMGLGHMLWVARLSPWRHEVDKVDGKTIEFLFLRVGDLVGSETLLKMIRDGLATVEQMPDGSHRYKFKDEASRPRFDPPSYVA